MRVNPTPIPEWVDTRLYPFYPRLIPVSGGNLSYVDTGRGRPVVMVHGNPTWSFLYRDLILNLRDDYRCIVPDHIGFGLSDKPAGWDYTPEAHAENLERLLEALDVDDVTLVVQDWGGPIGLSWAIRHPDRVRAVVVMNSWMWPVNGDLRLHAYSRLMGSAMGRRNIRNRHYFVDKIMPSLIGRPEALSDAVWHHYRSPMPTPASREGCAKLPGQIIRSGPWLAALWALRSPLAKIPALLLWGERDRAFKQRELQVWQGLFEQHQTQLFANAGYYLPEEEPAAVVAALQAFLSSLD